MSYRRCLKFSSGPNGVLSSEGNPGHSLLLLVSLLVCLRLEHLSFPVPLTLAVVKYMAGCVGECPDTCFSGKGDSWCAFCQEDRRRRRVP